VNPHAIHPWAHLHVWHRFVIASSIGLLAGLIIWVLRPEGAWDVRLLSAWLVAGISYLSLLVIGLGKLDAQLSRWRAQRQDPGASAVIGVLTATILVSLLGVLTIANAASSMHGSERWLHIALALAALAINWLLIQAIFALRYARHYYAPDTQTKVENDVVEGLIFPGGQHPNYSDFAYFALVIGMTSQTADINIADTRMRRIAMLHGMTSFAYNILVLAMTLNLLAGALG
jgi:uncharacterized membrane protein